MLHLELLSRRRVRLVPQSQLAECGIACLLMVAGYHGLDIDLASFRRRFTPSVRGATVRGLIELAERLALLPRAVRVNLAALAHLNLPAILHWDLNHFVVVEKVTARRALIHDPAAGSRWLSIADVSAHFSGIAVELTPLIDFAPGRHRAGMSLSRLWTSISGVRSAMLHVVLLSLVLQSFVLISPYYLQSVVDVALPTSDTQLILIMAVGFGLFAVINATATLLRAAVLLAAGTSTGFGLATNVARHLLRLPIDWFERRQTGDVLTRFRSIEPIQRWLTRNAPETLIDGSLAILTLVMMTLYSPVLAAVAVGAVMVYAVTRVISYPRERAAREGALVATGREQTSLIESIRGMTTLRVLGGEAIRHAVWQNRLIDALNADIRLARVGIVQNALNVLIFGVETVISIAIAARMIIAGDAFTLGMLFAFMAYKLQFVTKATSLADQLTVFLMLRLHVDRLSDIVLGPAEPHAPVTTDHAVQGTIELRDLGFRYADHEPWIFRNVNLTVTAGEHVVITGPSGGGKSTLLKVLLGVLQPCEGEVLVDGHKLATLGAGQFRRWVGTVLQEDTLFTGSLGDNIGFFADHIDLPRVIEAAKLASIHDTIMAMPMRYETPVGDMGSSLSGGQKQRVLLARALYRRPALLVMDEGTAFLDKAQEKAVNRAVTGMGITRIIVAHRRETIDAADRVVALERGRIVAFEPVPAAAAD